jgi:hypothetical protein
MLLAGALGPVFEGPGKQPPRPSGPSGTFGVLDAQPLGFVGGLVGGLVGVGGAVVAVGPAVSVGDALVDWVGGGSVGAPLGLVLPDGPTVVVTVVVAVAVAPPDAVTVTAGGFGTVHTTVICCAVPTSVTFGLAVHVARVVSPPWLVAACATATVPPQTSATAARGIRVRLDICRNLLVGWSP